MDLFSIIILLAIFAETSAVAIKTFTGKNGRSGRNPRRKVFVDTSILMDGRILSVAKAGFLGDEVLIPRSVVRELQLLADGSDSEKRARARYGLDVINELERVELADVKIYQDSTQRSKVDERLIELAKDNNGIIKLNVKIISVGSNPKQGVAYLPDGTMVVIDDAERFAGKNLYVDIVFERYLQTAAGRMMFAKLAPKEQKQGKQRKPKQPRGRNANKSQKHHEK